MRRCNIAYHMRQGGVIVQVAVAHWEEYPSKFNMRFLSLSLSLPWLLFDHFRHELPSVATIYYLLLHHFVHQSTNFK